MGIEPGINPRTSFWISESFLPSTFLSCGHVTSFSAYDSSAGQWHYYTFYLPQSTYHHHTRWQAQASKHQDQGGVQGYWEYEGLWLLAMHLCDLWEICAPIFLSLYVSVAITSSQIKARGANHVSKCKSKYHHHQIFNDPNWDDLTNGECWENVSL